jgi:hypothetical protein
VARARSGVQGGHRPQRRPPQSPEPVLVDGLDAGRPLGGQLARTGDAHRVVAVVDQDRLRSDPDREGQARELAERPRRAGRQVGLAPDRLRHRPLQPDAAAAGVRRPRLHQRAAPARRAEVRHRQHAVHQPGLRQLGQQPCGAHLTEPPAVERREHERLGRRAPLQHARQLDQRGRVGGAPVAIGDHHDLAARAPGAAADHVHERPPRVREALELHGEAVAREDGL